jgi:hypothetical protein
MKYSFLMPYYKRSSHLHNTLISFLKHYGDRNDYEVLILEDEKNYIDENEHNNLMDVVNSVMFEQIKISVYRDNIITLNPSVHFNYLASRSNSDYLILTNPECFHKTNILNGFDEIFSKNKHSYPICSCISGLNCKEKIYDYETFKYDFQTWYIHSIHQPRKLHFCTAILKDNFFNIGGFDEDYIHGIGWEDDDFYERVNRFKKINVEHHDELEVIHIEHDRGYVNMDLYYKNMNLFNSKWRTIYNRNE